MTPAFAFRLAWGIWLLSWIAAAGWSSSVAARSTARDGLAYGVPIALGAIILFSGTSRLLGATRLWNVGTSGAWVLAGLTVLCFVFAWWARIHLGKLWSAEVARKEDHRIIDIGPYALVRHPIYTALIGATLLTAAAKATVPAIVGAALITFGLWLKARLEEEFLSRELGSAYLEYRRRVPMLVPFGPSSR